MDESWDLQLERWLAGALSVAEEQTFLQQSNADPVRLGRLGRVLRQQALLAEHLLAKHLGAARQEKPAHHHRWWLGTAAAALLAIMIGWWAIPVVAPMARIIAGDNAPQIERNGRRVSTSNLMSGDTVSTSALGTRIELLDEATVITCAPDTRLRLDAAQHERHIAVLRGRVDADVAQQRAERPLIFSTTEAQVTVIGTQLSVVAEVGATAIAVRHGAVRVSGPTSADAVVVSAGQSAQVSTGQAPLTRPLQAGWEVMRGLVGHWPLDEGAGAVVHDVSGHGHHSRSLTAAWTAGHSGSALTFTGQFGGEWVDLGPQDLGTPAGVTVAAWVKTSSRRFGTVFSGDFTVGSGASTQGIPESEVPGADDAAGYVNFLTNRPAGRLDSPQRITDDRWHHLTWTWEADGWRRIWIDGVQVAARQDPFERERRWNAWHWAIGAASDRLVWNFAGIIDEVRLYDRALGAAEISRLAGQTSP